MPRSDDPRPPPPRASGDPASPGAPPAGLAAVAIGRNEGDRLRACLASLAGRVERIVYVDSGSSDGSVALARAFGAEVVALDMDRPFTAARARNAGLAALPGAGIELVQFLDGDCALQPGWLPAARAFLRERPACGAVCGRRRERHPEASVFNMLCDLEWDTPPGEARACGGDALMRVEALRAVGGFREDLIAGEEPELCVRLRAAGWTIWRLEREMTLHDAAMTRPSQWWRRARRGGYAFAEGAFLHGAPPERHWVRETRRAIAWGALLPAGAVAGALALTPWALLLLLAYPLQVLRLAGRAGRAGRLAALFHVLAKFPEALGALEFHARRRIGRRAALIEYK